jgi:hypothetical protein
MHKYICGEHKQKIDHINRNKQDNRKSNLRLVSNSLNGFNIDLQSNNTSGKTGVSYLKKNNTYMVYIGHDNQNIYLGCYKSFDEAVKVRQQAELKYFGELSDTKEITKSKDTNKESLQFPVFVGLREIGKEVSYE